MSKKCNENSCGCGSKSKPKTRNCTVEVLEELLKNLGMGKQSLTNILSKAKATKLTDELTAQLESYSKLFDKSAAMLNQIGGEAGGEGLMTKMSAKIGIEMNTIADASDEHIAQMVIEGTTMGITDIIRLIRDYENSNCSEEALNLAKQAVAFQEKAVETMKKFL